MMTGGIMTNYSEESVLTGQGCYFYRLVKEAGWDREQVQQMLLKKFMCTHWNAIQDPKKQKQALKIMKYYRDKVTKEKQEQQVKKLRHTICAIWCKSGKTVDELHEYMVAWGFGDSLRKCKKVDLIRIKQFVETMAK